MTAFKIFKKEIKKKTIGEILKRARLKKGDSLEQVEEATKIRLRYLVAIEENDWDKLPVGPYTVGFLKKYCQYLGVPFNKIENQYQQEMKVRRAINKMIPKRREIRPPRIYITPKILGAAFLAIVVISVFGYIIYQILGFTSSPYLLIKSPVSESIVEENPITVSGQTQKGARLYINGAMVGIDTEGNFSQEVYLKEGSNIINITALNKTGKKTEKNLIILYKPKQ